MPDLVYALSFHADYRCRHSGVCCSSDWNVPVEVNVYRSLDEALRAGRVNPVASRDDCDPPLLTGEDLPGDAAAMLGRTHDGDCVFLDRGSRLCAVHRDGGEALLPATCRHYPRLAVRDARGTFISLTHYCPTASEMLFRDDMAVDIVSSPAAFPPGDYDGLTVTAEDWAPLLHPAMLMNLDGYSAWERHMVARCSTDAVSPECVLATLERDARVVRGFVPGRGSLSELVATLPPEFVDASPHVSLEASFRLRDEVMGAVPDDLKPSLSDDRMSDAYLRYVAPAWSRWHRPVNRYLAAKAFANWTAYQGKGLLTIVRGLEAALALVRIESSRHCRDAGRDLDRDSLREAFRAADFLLNHLAVGEALAAGWAWVEGT